MVNGLCACLHVPCACVPSGATGTAKSVYKDMAEDGSARRVRYLGTDNGLSAADLVAQEASGDANAKGAGRIRCRRRVGPLQNVRYWEARAEDAVSCFTFDSDSLLNLEQRAPHRMRLTRERDRDPAVQLLSQHGDDFEVTPAFVSFADPELDSKAIDGLYLDRGVFGDGGDDDDEDEEDGTCRVDGGEVEW